MCTLAHIRAHAHMHAKSYILFIYSSALPGTTIHPWSNKINSVWSFDRMNDQTVSFVLMAVEASVETICAWARVRACQCVCGRTLHVRVRVCLVCLRIPSSLGIPLSLLFPPTSLPCRSCPAEPIRAPRLCVSYCHEHRRSWAGSPVHISPTQRSRFLVVMGHVRANMKSKSCFFGGVFVTVARWSVWKKPKHLEKAAVSTTLQRNNVIL